MASPDDDKKERERRIIAGAFDRIGFRDPVITMRERPDAIVEVGAGDERLRVGVELQLIFGDDGVHGSALRRFKGRWQNALSRVADALRRDARALPPCVVSFRDQTYECLDSISQADLVAEMIALAKQLEHSTRLEVPFDGLPILSGLLREIRVGPEGGNGPRWWPSHLQSGSILDLSSAVACAIAAKSRIAETYDWADCQCRWLLLFAGATGLSDIIGGPEHLQIPGVASAIFTAVIVWDKAFEHVWRLSPDVAIICDGLRQTRSLDGVPLEARRFVTGDEYYPTRAKGGAV